MFEDKHFSSSKIVKESNKCPFFTLVFSSDDQTAGHNSLLGFPQIHVASPHAPESAVTVYFGSIETCVCGHLMWPLRPCDVILVLVRWLRVLRVLWRGLWMLRRGQPPAPRGTLWGSVEFHMFPWETRREERSPKQSAETFSATCRWTNDRTSWFCFLLSVSSKPAWLQSVHARLPLPIPHLSPDPQLHWIRLGHQ